MGDRMSKMDQLLRITGGQDVQYIVGELAAVTTLPPPGVNDTGLFSCIGWRHYIEPELDEVLRLAWPHGVGRYRVRWHDTTHDWYILEGEDDFLANHVCALLLRGGLIDGLSMDCIPCKSLVKIFELAGLSADPSRIEAQLSLLITSGRLRANSSCGFDTGGNLGIVPGE